jgi:hypothetical protein
MKKKDHPILVGKTKETIAKLQGKSISTVSTKAQGVPRLKKLDVGSMIQKSNAAAKKINAAKKASAPKTAADYRRERKATKQEFKSAKLEAKNAAKLERIKSGENRGRGAKAFETIAGAAGTALGLVETGKRVFKKQTAE